MNAHAPTLSDIGRAALSYAERGWHVFPAPPGEKKSYKSAEFSGGRKWGATVDPAEVCCDWSRWNAANVGIVTGEKSGFFVVECDTPEGHDVDGIGNMAALLEEHGPLPDTIEALSPTGSWHIYFRWPECGGIINKQGLVVRDEDGRDIPVPGIDVRGEGGMVIGVPSIKPGNSAPYRWKNPPGPFDLAECPDWLLALCREKLSERATPTGNGRFAFDIGRDHSAWANKALTEEVARLLSAPQGTRNEILNKVAFSLGQIIGGGYLDEQDIRQRLHGAAIGIGLEEGEALATIESGVSAGKQNARHPQERTTDQHQDSTSPDGEDGDIPVGHNADDDFDLSHDALAIELGRRSWDRNARYVAAWGKWLFWSNTGSHWQRDDRREDMTRVRVYLRTRAHELIEWGDRKAAKIDAEEGRGKGDRLRTWAKTQATLLCNRATVAAVETMAQSNPRSAARTSDFDSDLMIVGTPGGTLDLHTGDLRPARREEMITKQTAVAPAPKGTLAPIWTGFLNDIFEGNQDIIGFMQRAAGYALTGLTVEHKLLFLHGTGRNGKSTFLETLEWIWGDYSRHTPAETLLYSQTQQHSTNIAALDGARLVIGSELPKGKVWDEAVIKNLTGGEKQSARFLYGNLFEFDPQLTLMIAGNNMPSFRGVDEAIRSRVALVPFTVTIPEERQDKDLKDKLKDEAPAILRWAVEGALEWQRRGLDVPVKIAAASQDYFDDEDVLGQFLADETEPVPGYFTATTDLHRSFRQWMDVQGLNAWTSHTFTKEMKLRGFQDVRRSYGRGFLGLKLRFP